MEELERFIARMSRLGIKLQLEGNYPWVYLESVNGNTISRRYGSEHGYVLGFTAIRLDAEKSFDYYDLKDAFKTIRDNI
jgi:hypothetical protein